MKRKEKKHRILILGGSGFLGHAIYSELCKYYMVFGTYYNKKKPHKKNTRFFYYNHQDDDIITLLKHLKPTIIISALRGDFLSQIVAHQRLYEYIKIQHCKIIFLSSANVFDAYSKYPSYEYDTTLSNSIYGHFKIKIEHILLKLSKRQVAIIRLPMVFGSHSPRIKELKSHLKEHQPIEIFPNLVINVTTDRKVTQQVHYIINRNKYGVFHLGSKDLVHHDDFIKNIVTILNHHKPKYKHVYTTNNDRYLAVLPKDNLLPKHLQIFSKDILSELDI